MEYNLFIILGLLTVLLTSCASFQIPYTCYDGTTTDNIEDCKDGIRGGGGLFDFLNPQEGCSYNSPTCSKNQVCENNKCIERKGCKYDNPICSNDQECINNVCVKSFKGCAYDNPTCSEDYYCLDNECIKKDGCLYENPSCNFGYECINNSCVFKKNSDDLAIYENIAPYYGIYCDKINPYDLSIRTASADAIRNNPGAYSYGQLFDIYDWVKKNIIYQTVPLGGIPYYPQETLITKSGDCKNQAVLIASMVEAVGGSAKVVVDPDCLHAYSIVYFGSIDTELDTFNNAVKSHYGSNIDVKYFTYENGIWVIFDPAGAFYPGDTLPECSGERMLYFIKSCMDCFGTYGNSKQYTYGDLCYSACPEGTIKSNNNACEKCEDGYFSCNNECWKCSDGSYLNLKDCLCYTKCPFGTITKDYKTCEACPAGYDSCNNGCWKCEPGRYLNQDDCLCYK